MADVKWFVAFVRSCQERKVAECLKAQGIDVYVPIQKEERKWSDRIKIIDRLIFPRMVFVHCTENVRKSTFKLAYGITSYMMDATADKRAVLIVPDKQMEDFIRVVSVMNGGDEITVDFSHIEKGDIVRIIRGPLKDFICECVEIQNQHKIIIRLGLLGSVLTTISASDVIKE